MSRRKKKKSNFSQIVFILFIVISIYIYFKDEIDNYILKNYTYASESYDIENIPEYEGEPYIILDGNKPNFSDDDYQKSAFESYSDLDYLGRTGVAFANIGTELMPKDDRESISNVKPTGWKQAKYDIVSGGYLYNRCHLIGYQLTGENDNPNNLITCTRSMNIDGMLDFENKVADYIKNTNNHVLYRVSPIYEDDNLLASGVQIEASSVEDKCKDICFNVYVYNVEDGIEINYYDGSSKLA